MGRDVQIKEERVKEGETIEKAKCSIKSEEYKMCMRGDKKKNKLEFFFFYGIKYRVGL